MKFTANATLENPLRDIILNREELLKHAVEIARFHIHVGTTHKQRKILPRFMENTKFLKEAHSEISHYGQKTKDVVSAAEWFLDNYYLLKDSRYEVPNSMPWRYERQLPRVAGGDFAGFPRIYALLVELVEHTDSELNANVLMEFINDYQKHIPLTTGELWAIPSILKMILIENIRRLVEQVLRTQVEREAADRLISRIMESPGQLVKNWSEILEEQNSREIYTPEYAERLFQRIRELGIDGGSVLRWLERSVSKHGLTIEALAKLEHQRQAMCQVSMGHAILSVRFTAEEDWPRFFEGTSMIEKALGEDPAGIYLAMDFASRDKYRQEIEKIARQFKVAESVIARKVIVKAQEAESLPQTHVGYYLMGAGRIFLEMELENEWGKIRRLWCQIRRVVSGDPHTVYFGSLSLISLAFFYALLPYTVSTMRNLNPLTLVGVILLLIIPVTSISVPLTNWIITRIIPPVFFPKLELRGGIPSELRTIVVVPTLLTGVERVQELLRQLEIYYLANQDPHLHFALLGDYKDSKEEKECSDAAIIEVATKGIEKLNKKYGLGTFFLFNRKRLWNPSEGQWMGWERKRGKLLEFNRLLMGLDTTITEKVGELSLLPQIKYVITLDADTQLPRGVAKKLIGTMAHPLHTPVLNDEETRVIKGYGVLQPRIGVSLQSALASPFARIFSGQAGIDPYTTAVSDIYQDLFGEGIFTGKGIYDVKAFHQVTDRAFPENKILSHDLIEGIYARAGLVTDIELIDGYPAKYHAFLRRAHRWIRGDWQIISWLTRPLPWQAKWKILDNLRRSLEAPSLLLVFILGLTIFQRPWFWVGIVFGILLWHSVLGILNRFFDGSQASRPLEHELRDRAIQAVFQFALLPFQAYTNLDAIVRAVYRQLVSQRKMLEWETAADTDQRIQVSFLASLQVMWQVGLFLIVFGLVLFKQGTFTRYLPILAIWGSSPWLAYHFSRPQSKINPMFNEGAKKDLRIWGRKIWAFFEEYVTADENWLPPDNVQIDPPKGIAHRTSPTNIGLALLANLTAWDLGYLTLETLQKRITGTLDTLDKLDQWHGHFYNWYDTLSLKPLNPLYVSTVDSGNLVVYCITLEHGLQKIEETPVFGVRPVQGLMDTVHLLENACLPAEKAWLGELKEEITGLLANFDLLAWYHILQKWIDGGGIVSRLGKEDGEEITFWAIRLEGMMKTCKGELELVCPWITENTFRQEFYANGFRQEFTFTLPELLDLYTKGEGLAKDDQLTIQQARKHIEGLLKTSRGIRERLRAKAYGTDFKPLFDFERQLFSIGYRLNEGELDKSYYDLLASEARQASFMAIAKGDVPQSHWFKLGRSMTRTRGLKGLVSWSGTMFEFLMPLIVMKDYKNTLLDGTYRTVVEVQRRFANDKKIPWGISESGFYAFDAQLNYQYKAFGVPGLGLKRGLIQDLVIAPYATFLALMVEPVKSLDNLRQMREKGFEDRYGFFEAIDYTPERIPLNEDFRIVKSYMAHHQGMSFAALGNILFDNLMQQRFHEEPSVQATELLLQERLPSEVNVLPHPEGLTKTVEKETSSDLEENRYISYKTPATKIPATHLVSNGDYSVMVNNSGSGYSRWNNLAVSRWREDVTQDSWGMYFYLQNLNSGSLWSATYQPVRKTGEDYLVTYSPDRVEFYRKDGNIVTRTEIFVSAEDQVEIRRISLSNLSQHDRIVEITSYFEVVLAPQNADSAHPAFSNLFIETQFDNQALLASRRPRSEKEPRNWLMHTVAVEGEEVGVLQYETDRVRFIGRGRDLANPQALEPNQPLSNTVGAVLDPIMSLRQRVRIPPSKTVRASFVVGVAANRGEVMRLAQKYRNPVMINRAYELAWTHSQMELRHLNLSPALANEALSLAGYLLYLSPLRRKYAEYIAKNTKGQSSLWPYALSGDLPVIVVQVKETAHLNLVRQLVAVHEYWRFKGLSIDLLILNEDNSGYVQSFQEMLRDVVTMGHAQDLVNKPGGIFILQKSHLPEADLTLILTVARVVFTGDEGSFTVQLKRKLNKETDLSRQPLEEEIPNTLTSNSEKSIAVNDGDRPPKAVRSNLHNLLMFNGIGGFSNDGKEYVIELKRGVKTPLPWLNVIANSEFGFQVTEAGGGYTWSKNSRENKLTPWSNDPVMDRPSEVLYIKDLANGKVWNPTPNPIGNEEAYTVRHGQGYSIFEHQSYGINQEVLMFVPIDKPIKVSRLTLRNTTRSERKLQLTYYVEWVLGVSREQTAPYVITDYDEMLKVLKARNVFQEEFAGRTAFMMARGAEIVSYSGDRTSFLGRNRNLKQPEGLSTAHLEQIVGAGLDPCGAMQVEVILQPQAVKEVCFFLGEVNTSEQLESLVLEFQNPDMVNTAFANVVDYWDNLLSTVQVTTPDDSLNLLVNRWLLYQTLSCRIWARSAFYQSGGAYGFRDQLQDVMALVIANPSFTREQILKHCAHQFKEGDVQHWWHQEKGKGIRTKFSDDLLWLPFVTLDYLEHTQDYSILEVEVPFLEDDLLGDDEDERYTIPKLSDHKGTVYDHCIRAIEKSLKFGEHGIPLIGTGDWNDGFSRIGRKGKGESIWLGWFQLSILRRFALLSESRGETERANKYLELASQLNESMEKHAWDGGWYRRAYFDDGTPLGSNKNEECQIDAIAQSWSVLSGGARKSRAEDAMLALEHYLLKRDEGMLLLLTPPFDKFEPDPGYIKGYVPGVRENGGQYTHGAIWAIMAFAQMGEGEKATEVFHLLNPINHTRTEAEVARYKTEPYVMAADVYAKTPHVGRGGWTWYTGAAGWMYQAAIEGILGFKLRGDSLEFTPCIPKEWDEYRIDYRYQSTLYKIRVINPGGKNTGVSTIQCDGDVIQGTYLKLIDDGHPHEVTVLM